MRPKDKHRVARLGSFWHDTHGLREDAACMSRTMNAVDPDAWFAEALARVTNKEWTPVNNEEIRIQPDSVLRVGLDFGKRIMEEVGLSDGSIRIYRRDLSEDVLVVDSYVPLAGWGDQALRLDVGPMLIAEEADAYADEIRLALSGMVDRFILPIDVQIQPSAILTSTGRRLQVGLQFETHKGLLVFLEDPELLFPEGIMTVISGYRTDPHIFGYSESIEHVSGSPWILEYFRNRQDLPSFERALASVANLTVLRKAGTLLSITSGLVTIYHFDWGSTSVGYEHTVLTLGYYPRGYIIGDLKLHGGSNDWWTRLDWKSGLHLIDFQQYDVVLPNNPRGCWAESESDGKLHAKFKLLGTTEELDAFWASQKATELSTGVYLNDVLNFTAVGQSKTVNPLQFLLSNICGFSTLALDLKGSYLLGQATKLKRFLDEHKPIGTLTTYIR